MKRVAVVGAGIAGMAAAHALTPHAEVTLFESDRRFGGHAHTVDMTLGGVTHGVDTGFLVYNHRTYPQLVRLFEALRVDTAPSEMSFSVQSHALGLEWSGTNLNTVFAQRTNLLRPRFLGMLADILRFNKLCTALAERGGEAELAESIEAFLDRHRFDGWFREGYLLPMIGCIWSCPTDQMLQFPIATLIRFCHNHGLIQVTDRPQWHTVRGGSRQYVDKLVRGLRDARSGAAVRAVRRLPAGPGPGGVIVATDHGSERFDDVVLACHSDQSLALLAEPSSAEREVLAAVRYQANHAVLHTDAAVLPRRRLAWAAWNYARAKNTENEQAGVCLHYLINRLQPLPWSDPVIVSLNPDPLAPPAPGHVVAAFEYAHPVFDLAAIRAQQRLPAIQGGGHVWYCGAWTRYGFHEDGLGSALDVVDRLRACWRDEAAAGLAESEGAAA
jgi:predicted NAD/FAD-binding protein